MSEKEPEQKKLKFEIPGVEEPGFLRRQRACFALIDTMRSGRATAKDFDNLITFLLQFVTAPADRTEATELLLELSRADYNNLLSAVMQESDGPLSPLRSKGSSADS